ncbi:BLUF domain-containing protein [Spirosoma endophyticum]|uniref:Sensors of blue-light using FAD n=1 Tax=Spirosoma endophyticum TaxID=662367 RepID=A0A1I1S9K6_9BACT|nr:BLUF domain-containing protein [Spirosoma endophyticum]SFD43022.1 Sensors of blue-light using FAD [Spirosoma endophyticum]
MEYCIVYISASKGLFSEVQLTSILEHSRQSNSLLGITGVMLYFNGSIIQVLEGEEEQVKTLYNTIRQDPRHTSIIQFFSHPIEKRSFSEWSMGYISLSTNELGRIKDQVPFIGDPTLPALKQDNVILSVLQTFYLNNYRN